MGLFDRGRKSKLEGGIEGIAVIRESVPLRTAADKRPQGGEYVTDNLQQIGIGKREYRFTLELRVPDREPYEVEGTFKVPAKAESTGLTSRKLLFPGLSLPVRVDPGDPARFEIDWDAFLASPDRKAAVEKAAEAGRAKLTRKRVEANPEQAEKMRAGNRVAVQAWVGAVRAGNMSREEFERDVQLELDSGRMDPADAEAARRTLDS